MILTFRYQESPVGISQGEELIQSFLLAVRLATPSVIEGLVWAMPGFKVSQASSRNSYIIVAVHFLGI